MSDRNDAEFVNRLFSDEKDDREVSFATDVPLIVKTLRVGLVGAGI